MIRPTSSQVLLYKWAGGFLPSWGLNFLVICTNEIGKSMIQKVHSYQSCFDYFRPAFLAWTRALVICFFHPKHWLQAEGQKKLEYQRYTETGERDGSAWAYQQTHASCIDIPHLYFESQEGIQCPHGRWDQTKEIRKGLKCEEQGFINTPGAKRLYFWWRNPPQRTNHSLLFHRTHNLYTV